jgi:hypothetical protein
MGIGLALLSLVLATSPATLRVKQGEVEVDHAQGTVTARAGAAADLRMPTPQAARPGAERRAVATADGRLREALDALMAKRGEGLGKPAVEAALAKATTSQVEYQSNGGVFVWRRLAFTDFGEGKTHPRPPVALVVPAMPARVVPAARVGDRTVRPAYAILRDGAAPATARAAKWDAKQARLTLAGGDATLAESLAGAVWTIYVGKLEP